MSYDFRFTGFDRLFSARMVVRLRGRRSYLPQAYKSYIDGIAKIDMAFQKQLWLLNNKD